MAPIDSEYERRIGAARKVIETALAPLGGSAACIDAYEAGIRLTVDYQLAIARTLGREPARAYAATCADLIRDIGATQVSSARWLMDV